MKYLHANWLLGIALLLGGNATYLQAQEKILLLKEVTPKEIIKAGPITLSDNVVEVGECKDKTRGVRFKKSYDLSNYKDLRFQVENCHATYPMQLLVEVQSRDTTFREPVEGILNKRYIIEPGEKRTITFPLWEALDNKTSSRDFRLMRSYPYSRLTQTCSYDLDLKHVLAIKFITKRVNDAVKWRLSNIEILPGKPHKLPNAMKWEKSDFYPFIDQYGQFKHANWPGKTHSDKDLQRAMKREQKDLERHPGAGDWSKFGGWAKGKRLQATGHFHVEKVDGKWWMIDPEGYLFWSNGVVRVTPSSAITPLEGENLANRCHYFDFLPKEGTPFAQFYRTHDVLLHPYYTDRGIDSTFDFSSANCYRKYGENYKALYADLAHKRLRSWGLNTIANSSDKAICRMDRTAYTDRFEIFCRPLEGTTGWHPFMDPYDKGFEQSLRRQFSERRAEVDDPWCLGLFVDNEIQWGSLTYLAEMTWKAPADQPCKEAMLTWLQQKYSTIEQFNQAWELHFYSWQEIANNRAPIAHTKGVIKQDLHAFNREIIRKYFSTIKAIFTEQAPWMLYMGCRFAGSTADVVNIGAEYCDVMSYNAYKFDLSDFGLPQIDKPIMIGEYHFGALDRGMFNASLLDVENQQRRGKAVEQYIRSALRNPQIIGVHWHQFADQATTGRFDGEDFQVGLTDCCDTPYWETIEGFRRVGYQMYDIRFTP